MCSLTNIEKSTDRSPFVYLFKHIMISFIQNLQLKSEIFVLYLLTKPKTFALY